MNISKLVNNLSSFKLRGTGQNFAGKVSDDAPLASLIGCVVDYATQMRNSLPRYDSVACALSSIDEVYAYYGEIQSRGHDKTINTNSDVIIDLSDDSGDVLYCGIKDAYDSIEAGQLLTVTSVSGLAFSMTVVDETVYCSNAHEQLVPVLWRDSKTNIWKMRINWPSTASSFAPEGTIDRPSTVSSLSSRALGLQPNGDLSLAGSTVFDRLKRLADLIAPSNDAETIEDCQQIINQEYDVDDNNVYDSLTDVTTEQMPPEEIVDDSMESVTTITEGLVVSSTMNEVICDSVDAVTSNTISGYLDVAQTKYSQKPTVKSFVSKMVNAYKVGGLRGFLLFIIRLIKAQGSIVDDNGRMKFTDNAALVPQQFVVGLIATIVGAVLTVVGTILTIVAPIIGVIVSSIGTLLWSVIGSAKSTYNDTFARVETFLTEQEELYALPYSPMALFRGSASINNKHLRWYKDFYNLHQTCTYIQVPGGCLFIGPGSFKDDGSLATVRCEFHPFTLAINSVGWAKFAPFFARSDDYPGKKRPHFRIVHPNYVFSYWKRVMDDHDCYSTVTNNDDGHLKDEDDKKVCSSVIACCGVFLYWLTLLNYNGDWLDEAGYFLYGPYYANGYPDQAYVNDCYSFNSKDGAGWCINALATLANLDAAPENLADWASSNLYLGNQNVFNWANLVGCADKISTSGSFHIADCASYLEGHYTQFDDIKLSNKFKYLFSLCNELLDGSVAAPKDKYYWNLGLPRPLPERPKYCIFPPTIDRTTYWLWAALTIAITTVAVTTAVIGSLKFNKWRKARRLINAENATEARNSFADALAGRRQVYNPQTHQYDVYEFDVNSPEGQAYINAQMKNYKMVCLKNNLMANVIGGTRYDYSSFWGDKDESVEETTDADSPNSNLRAILYDTNEDGIIDVESIDNPEPNLQDVINLIRGPVLSGN